jgi:hypothetical protein
MFLTARYRRPFYVCMPRGLILCRCQTLGRVFPPCSRGVLASRRQSGVFRHLGCLLSVRTG